MELRSCGLGCLLAPKITCFRPFYFFCSFPVTFLLAFFVFKGSHWQQHLCAVEVTLLNGIPIVRWPNIGSMHSLVLMHCWKKKHGAKISFWLIWNESESQGHRELTFFAWFWTLVIFALRAQLNVLRDWPFKWLNFFKNLMISNKPVKIVLRNLTEIQASETKSEI